MKRNLIAIIATLALTSAAHATVFGNTTNTTNNQGGQGGKADASAAAAASAVGVGVGVGHGGNASNSTNVSTDVRNTNANTNLNSASQHQAAISGGNTVTSTTTIVESQRPVASAIAAPLAASNGTCMGSTSAGAQGVTIGLSVGTTWTDSSCDARYDAQALSSLGQPVAALARLCQKAEIAAAVEASGQKCPSKPAPAMKTAEVQPVQGYTGNDPIVRARLGLAPLSK
jgi:hypothetical protein